MEDLLVRQEPLGVQGRRATRARRRDRLTVGVVHQVAAGENPGQVGAGARRIDEDVTLVVQVYLTSD